MNFQKWELFSGSPGIARAGTYMPDWKVCRMHGGSLLCPKCLRGCVCVTKQWFYCFLLLFYENFAAGTAAKI